MTIRLQTLFNRAKDIYQEEGLSATIKRLYAFIISAISYENNVFYVYEHILEESNEADYLPKIPNVTHRIVETVDQLDELQNEGFGLSLSDIDQSRYRLEKGAILSLLFIDREFASISWAAFSEEAKNTFNRYPYKVNFANNEICGGGTLVNPKYRGQGLYYYTLYKKEQFLVRKGAVKHLSIALSNNIASHTAKIKMGNKLLAKARYIRIFGLQFWRENSVNSTDDKN